MQINEQWLAEFAACFVQHVEDGDGWRVGRWLWNDMDDAWRLVRAVGTVHAYSDAQAEAEAWINTHLNREPVPSP